MTLRVSTVFSLALLGLSQVGQALVPRQEATFSNPVIWADLADDEVFRVGDTYYYSASTMHYSPGAPLLRSYDLVNWEFVSHSVPELPGSKFSLNGSDSAGYVNGVWASSLGYRESNGVFYWYGCIQGTDETHIYTASSPEGPWTHHDPIPKCYYDLGLLIDTDDTMYIAYGAIDIRLAQLSPDGFTEVRNELVYTEDAHRYIEGSRFYHINGNYYIWVTKPGDEQHVLKSTSGPWGPYEIRQVIAQMKAPVEGAGAPHQGGLVSTEDGRWYYMAFIDVYPGGRAPVLAPVEFDAEGWPSVVTDANGGWGAEYAMPVTTSKTVQGVGSYVDKFEGDALNPRWEWNHNPDNDAWSLGPDGLTLHTATVCEGLYGAANTLTQRIIGPRSQATFRLDISGMVDGDQAGVAALRQLSAYVGIHKVDGASKLVYVDEISMVVRDSLTDWVTTSNGYVKAEGPTISGGDLWLRIKADISPPVAGSSAWPNATFWFSTDGDNFEQLGPVYELNNEWFFFMGYRFSVFNWAKTRLGGSILVREFELEVLE
ncbi:glycosyl hydrolase family 43 [Colletotrichum scovillei]|uniref:glycosyl hydrolase family 43 n=1 Tax=Colletotrichum scovillei TaxID=1209932 RepID=UPI0015C3F1CE|nr:glycosyl hydrolase family 43 [Colletotrichum scovillei]KAF4781154.1 glycosyl hydrolase family 43 [Colletotrichum scovillei]KAG7052798.1 glycosyl hydrolase family 43 [Colletotrichum scovillei]